MFKTSEFNANLALDGIATERARWAAVLAKPATRGPVRITKRKSVLARLFGL